MDSSGTAAEDSLPEFNMATDIALPASLAAVESSPAALVAAASAASQDACRGDDGGAAQLRGGLSSPSETGSGRRMAPRAASGDDWATASTVSVGSFIPGAGFGLSCSVLPTSSLLSQRSESTTFGSSVPSPLVGPGGQPLPRPVDEEELALLDPSLPRPPVSMSVAAGSVVPVTGTAFPRGNGVVIVAKAAEAAVADADGSPAAASSTLVFDRSSIPIAAPVQGSSLSALLSKKPSGTAVATASSSSPLSAPSSAVAEPAMLSWSVCDPVQWVRNRYVAELDVSAIAYPLIRSLRVFVRAHLLFSLPLFTRTHRHSLFISQ